MYEVVFINPFISAGCFDYFDKNMNSSFEAHVIECLCDVYGKDKIYEAYSSKDENAFSTLLHVYGLSSNVYDSFLRDTLKYRKFMEEKDREPSLKSDIASKVEISIITMFLHKCLLVEPSLEEISHFENDLLNNFEIIKWHFNNALTPNRTRDVWDKKKRMLTDNVELVEIKPVYFDEFTYAKYGIKLADVQRMDYRMVDQLNSFIAEKQSNSIEVEKPTSKLSLEGSILKTSISSGSGFVDALLIAAVIATEMSIGLIYLFLNM